MHIFPLEMKAALPEEIPIHSRQTSLAWIATGLASQSWLIFGQGAVRIFQDLDRGYPNIVSDLMGIFAGATRTRYITTIIIPLWYFAWVCLNINFPSIIFHVPHQISPFRGYSISKRILKTLHHSHHPVLVLLENLEDNMIYYIYIYRGGAVVDKFVMRVIQRLIRFI